LFRTEIARDKLRQIELRRAVHPVSSERPEPAKDRGVHRREIRTSGDPDCPQVEPQVITFTPAVPVASQVFVKKCTCAAKRADVSEAVKRVLPLNDDALSAVKRMIERADGLGHTKPEHYLWCRSKNNTFDPSIPATKWDMAWRTLRQAAGLPGLRFHDLRHAVVTRLLEAGEPDHVVESITGHLSRRMLEHYSHIRLSAKKAALDRLNKPKRALK
jgi:hypothetical protein